MAETETNPLKQTLQSFFQEIPEILPSFQVGSFKTTVKFLYFNDEASAGIEKTLTIYPCQTLRDVKMKIARLLSEGTTRRIHPYQLSLLFPLVDEGEDETKQAREYAVFDSIWTKGSTTGKTTEINLANPFLRAKGGPDSNFVAPTGQKKPIGLSDHSRLLYEDALTLRTLTQIKTIHIFAVQDVLRGITAPRPLSEAEWFGKIHPYFPYLLPEQNGGITPEQEEEVDLFTRFEVYSETLLSRYDSLLTRQKNEYSKKEYNPYRLRLGGIKYLRLKWAGQSEEEEKSPDILFYELPVNHVRPYLRILPAEGTPVTKLLIESNTIQKKPQISDPKLLSIWTSEKSPSPDKDFLMVKTVIREAQAGLVPALYGTMRVYNDKTADYVLQAPRHLRRFDVKTDLGDLPVLLGKALEDTPYKNTIPTLEKASVLCGIRLPANSPQIRKDDMRARVQAMSYFFQEIIPLPGAPPFISLRYKAVSNFISQDRINVFLKQLTDRFLQEGRPDSEAIDYLMREFNLTRQEAISRYSKFREKGTEILIVDPEAREFVETYNYGIDISIYAQHPFYSFHIYGVQSEATFRRVLTALFLLFSTKSTDWAPIRDIVTGFNRVAEVVQGEAAPVPAETVPAAKEEANLADNTSPEDFGADGMNIGLADLMFETGLEPGNAANVEASTNPEAGDVPQITTEVNPRRNLAGVIDEPPQVVAAPKKGPAVERTELPTSFAQYFLERLQQTDRVLFDYPAAPGRSQYATRCQANVTRQPVVMSQEQFDVMLEKYGAARRQQFVRIGYDPATNEPFPDVAPETGEYVTCIFYGSDMNRSHYYLCPRFFCVHDYIVVFESDFESTIDSAGNAKPPNTCFFCHGKPIQNAKKRGPGETVYVRTVRPHSVPPKRHEWVGWLLDKSAHPNPALRVPCCFTQNYDVKATDEAFAMYRQKKKVGLPAAERVGLPPPVGAIPTSQPFLDYRITLDKIEGKYILGPEKLPLAIGNQTGPQIGLLPKILDAFFSQTPADIVSRDFTRMTLTPNAKGFLRVAVENRQSNSKEAFLAVLAPYLNENTIDGVRAKLDAEIQPRIFMNLNYGNLLIEFYDPVYPWEEPKDLEVLEAISDPTERQRTAVALKTAKLKEWASNSLGVDYENNEAYIERAYRSYKKFKEFLLDPLQAKEYRQFAHLLSAKLPLTSSRGIIFMILEIQEDNTLHVRCPPFGYDPEKHDGCDIGLIMHHWTGVWEPIFFVQKSSTYNPDFPLPPPILKFQQADAPLYWPEILRVRVEEFRGRCQSSGKSIYTSQRGISSESLARPLEAIQKLSSKTYSFDGYIKDAYNHTVALTFGTSRKVRDESGRIQEFFSTLIPVPVVDDGNITYFNKNLHLDWRDFEYASPEKVHKFYTTVVEPAFPELGYKIARKILRKGDNQILAFQLANGIPIPVAPFRDPKDIPQPISDLPISFTTDLEFEFDINRKIFFSEEETGTKEVEARERIFQAEQQDLDEVFQHVRYTFGNWLASDETPSDVKELIENTIKDRNLPLFEKRQRLYVRLGPMIESWMTASYDAKSETPPKYQAPELTTLLRVDCRLSTSCSGRCAWRTLASQSESGGDVKKCLIHTPYTASVGKKQVNAPRLFAYRIVEELLRYPEKRKQLLENKVSGLITIQDAILIGKNQYIVPEDTPAWYDLLRMDWATSGKDKPQFFEELSRQIDVVVDTSAAPSGKNILALSLPEL